MYRAYSIYDRKAKVFCPPFWVRSDREAVECVEPLRHAKHTKFATNPEDFVLYHIGSYDELTGQMIQEGQTVVMEVALIENQMELL